MTEKFLSPTRRSLLLAVAATLALAGCGSLLGPSNPPAQIYRLQPAFPPSGAQGPPVSWQLAVSAPDVSRTLETDRIALLRGARMDYYADAQWSDSVPRLVQQLLVEAFEKSGRIPAVARESGGLHADYSLESEIRDFDAQYDNGDAPPLVIVEIEAKLVNTRGEVVASLDARQTARASQNSVDSVVAAFDQASDAALAQIVTWTLQAPSPKP